MALGKLETFLVGSFIDSCIFGSAIVRHLISMLLASQIWDDVEILHAISILLFIKNLNTSDLVIQSFSLIKFPLINSLLVLQGIQKVLFLVVVEKLRFSAESVAIYDGIAPVTWRCVNCIKLFGGPELLAGLCGTATALLSILEWCVDLNQFIVDFVAIMKSETIGTRLNNIIWVSLNSVHSSLLLILSFDFAII